MNSENTVSNTFASEESSLDMPSRTYYRTIVISDVHLGSKYSKLVEAGDFLTSVYCDILILNGDIIDGWQLRKSGRKSWRPEYTNFFKIIMEMMEKYGTEVIYVRGNHDDFIDSFSDVRISNLTIVKDYILDSGNKKYFVTHGDIFDAVSSNMTWLAKLGDFGYRLLLWMNKLYNVYRMKKGKPYSSFSKVIKHKVKKAVSAASGFENILADVAAAHKCEGVICGHIHTPEDRYIKGIHYLNSGDWVESMSALMEDAEGCWKIYHYHKKA